MKRKFVGIFNLEIRPGQFLSHIMKTSAVSYESAKSNLAYRLSRINKKYLLKEIYRALREEESGKTFIIILDEKYPDF